MSTYTLKNCERPCIPSPCSPVPCQPCVPVMPVITVPSEKDAIISRLKSQVFDLEQQERDLETLNKKYGQLQRDFDILNDNKRRIECELKQRDDAYNQRICNLRGENENLQISHNEKMSLNKKLFADNENLAKTIDGKCLQIQEMNNHIAELTNQLNKMLCDKKDLEDKVCCLKKVRDDQNEEINKLIEDNQKLSQICQDQDDAIKDNEKERKRLQDEIDDIKYKQDEINGKLKGHLNNINKTKNDLENLNNENMDLEDKIRDYEKQFDNYKRNNDNLKQDIEKERALRADKEKQNDNLKNIISRTEKQIQDLDEDYNNLENDQKQTKEEEESLEKENQKLKEHVNLLTGQNQKLINELGTVMEQDVKMNDLLARKAQDAVLNRDARTTLDQTRAAVNDVEAVCHCAGTDVPLAAILHSPQCM